MVAVIDGDLVIAFGDYVQEDYPNNLLVEITQEQYDLLLTYIEPKYNGVRFYDNNFLYLLYENEKYALQNRLEGGKLLYSEFIARFRVLYKMGFITQESFDNIISSFAPVRTEILSSHIDLGKELFLQIDPLIFGQDEYDNILARFDFYIEEYYYKYPWEYTSKSFVKDIGGGGIKNPPKP